MQQYFLVDTEGKITGTDFFIEGVEIPEGYKKAWEGAFQEPLWSFTKNAWYEAISIDELLKESKESKKIELSLACQEAILGRFPSKHKGVAYSFSYDKEAQANFSERWNLFQNNIIESIMLTAKTIPGDEVKRILVTRDEFTVIYLDSIKHKENCISRLQDLLIPMVNNAVSTKQLEDIHWTNISLFPGEPSLVVKDDLTLAKGVEKAEAEASLAKDSSELTTMAFMEAMGVLFGQ